MSFSFRDAKHFNGPLCFVDPEKNLVHVVEMTEFQNWFCSVCLQFTSVKWKQV